jgi:hypothetical protein
MPLWFRIARLWLPIAFALTAACALAYGTGQQVYRQGLNDPQVAMAREAADRIDGGAPVAAVIPSGTVDIGKSLEPFIVVYGPDNSAVAGNGVLSGDLPVIPPGVLDQARSADENRVTWQPRPGVRIATVNVATENHLVLTAGRNMSEVESRISSLGQMTLAAWVVGVLGALVLVTLLELFGRRWDPPSDAADVARS